MHAVRQQDPPELCNPVRVWPVVVFVARESAEEVQLDLFGRGGQVAGGVVVGQQLLVVVGLGGVNIEHTSWMRNKLA